MTFSGRASQHAVDRFREHYPSASEDDLLRELWTSRQAKLELTPEIVRSMLQRKGTDRDGTAYFVEPAARGLFVVASSGIVVTYLRFQASQTAMVRRWFQIAETADLPPPPAPNTTGAPASREAALQEKEGLQKQLAQLRSHITALQAELQRFNALKSDLGQQMAELDDYMRRTKEKR